MAKSKYYYVMAKFQDGPRFVAKALLAHDIFVNSIFTDNYHDAYVAKDRSDAIAMRNKMEVSNYTYLIQSAKCVTQLNGILLKER